VSEERPPLVAQPRVKAEEYLNGSSLLSHSTVINM
jgi:hypothetical protein